MSKAYIKVKADLATAAAVETFVAANPSDYPLGTQIVAADGTLCVVTDSSGTTKLVTVGEPTP